MPYTPGGFKCASEARYNAHMPALPAALRLRRAPEIFGTVALLPFILLMDSPALASRFAANQWIANGATILFFVWMYRRAPRRLRKLMLIGLFVATCGEVLFALQIGMYEYRLGNVPVYVPPGHTILYAAIYYLSREPMIRRHQKVLLAGCMTIATGFSLYWLWAANDWYGFICFLVFCAIVAANRDSRLFFPPMFVLVLYLELLGTSIGNWYWHPTLLDRPGWISSGNPPAGISVFYFGFDIGCLGLYMLMNLTIRARYDRQKAWKNRLLSSRPEAVASWHRLGW